MPENAIGRDSVMEPMDGVKQEDGFRTGIRLSNMQNTLPSEACPSLPKVYVINNSSTSNANDAKNRERGRP
jgi:hypothetical protein